ncbi:hypothetical protein L1987_42364 [Smallanthus sonchifolius]|uniref:Uncharacterized protein n=1 Tax=Smallanthus sonchifolius TaxID=185202 RepID=A0ACB9GIQ1_9ASTR|nr:hypothetical protein L1987_42364 [Smallanthus sonchifolius]
MSFGYGYGYGYGFLLIIGGVTIQYNYKHVLIAGSVKFHSESFKKSDVGTSWNATVKIRGLGVRLNKQQSIGE